MAGSAWTPPDDPWDPPVYHTPLPLHVDAEIDRLALQLAQCRRNLDAQGILWLAQQLAHLTRSYRTPGNTR